MAKSRSQVSTALYVAWPDLHLEHIYSHVELFTMSSLTQAHRARSPLRYLHLAVVTDSQ